MAIQQESGRPSGTISKRQFLRGAAAVTLAGAAGRTLGANSADPWDLLVMGGGNAGLPAATFAARRGARVLIVEAAGVLGGTLWLSSGQMSAAGTKLQKSKGIVDTPQSHFDDVMRISKRTADAALVRLAVENAAPAFDWLTDNGLELLPDHPIKGSTHEPYSRARYAWGPQGGRSVLKVLNEQLAAHTSSGRVTVQLNTRVVELIQGKNGAVTGVVTKAQDGTTARAQARSVALTAGGYTNNPEMFEKIERKKTYSRATYPFSLGTGVQLGVAAGGYVRGGDKHSPLFGAVLTGTEFPAPLRALDRHYPPERPPYEIHVNSAGQRFMCEDSPSYTESEDKLISQPGELCWVVFDAAMFQAMPQLLHGAFGANGQWTKETTANAFAGKLPFFFQAGSVPALAQAAGIDTGGLVKTVAAYNQAQRSGHDPLGRKYMPLPIAKPPFYAIELHPWNLVSYGGLAVDNRLRVIRRNGSPIPNLYAAGEILGCGQLMGRASMAGMSVMPAITFGRLLGHELIAFS